MRKMSILSAFIILGNMGWGAETPPVQKPPICADIRLGLDSETKGKFLDYVDRSRQEAQFTGPEAVAALQRLREEFTKDPNKFKRVDWFKDGALLSMFQTALRSPRYMLECNRIFLKQISTQGLDPAIVSRVQSLGSRSYNGMSEDDRNLIVRDLDWLLQRTAQREALATAQGQLAERTFAMMDENYDVAKNFRQLDSSRRGQPVVQKDRSEIQAAIKARELDLQNLRANSGSEDEEIKIEKQIIDLQSQLVSAKEQEGAGKVTAAYDNYQMRLQDLKNRSALIKSCDAEIEKRDEGINRLATANVVDNSDLDDLEQTYGHALRSYFLTQALKTPALNVSNWERDIKVTGPGGP